MGGCLGKGCSVWHALISLAVLEKATFTDGVGVNIRGSEHNFQKTSELYSFEEHTCECNLARYYMLLYLTLLDLLLMLYNLYVVILYKIYVLFHYMLLLLI